MSWNPLHYVLFVQSGESVRETLRTQEMDFMVRFNKLIPNNYIKFCTWATAERPGW